MIAACTYDANSGQIGHLLRGESAGGDPQGQLSSFALLTYPTLACRLKPRKKAPGKGDVFPISTAVALD